MPLPFKFSKAFRAPNPPFLEALFFVENTMHIVNMLQAKSSLSRLVEAIEQGREREIVIARNGRPAAKLVPMDTVPSGKRIGIAIGLFVVPDSIDAHNDEVAQLFMGEGQS
jgi:antitoxin (DNA-binding transcriptional repressor) of toxin-antitoxin stability system